MLRAIGRLRAGGSRLNLDYFSNSNPLYLAHRGGALMYPENTSEAFANSFAAGFKALEMDVHALSDSALAVIHDATVDAATTGTGNVSSFNTAGFKALAIDANTWHGSNYGNALIPPLFTEFLSTYSTRAVVAPEIKVTAVKSTLVTAMQNAGVPLKQGLVQSFTLSDLADAVTAGYETCFVSSTAITPATVIAAGVRWVALSSAVADADIQAAVSAGLKVLVYTINRRWQRDHYLSLGVTGFYSDDPQYLSGTTALSTTDNFAAQTWQPGMFNQAGTTTLTSRGRFSSPNRWGWNIGSDFQTLLQGWASPFKGNASADTFTLDFKVLFNSVNAGDTTRWFSIFLGKNDKAFGDGVAPTIDQQGFLFLCRKNGTMQIYKRSTASASSVASTATPAIADGEEVSYRIVATPSALSVHRLDGSGNITHTATTSDSDTAFRGGYLHTNRGGASVDFSAISIT
jgi:glycerophosphoryl diester phosphodiesterase